MDMDQAPVNLTNHLLIAMPGLTDPLFSKTVTYICQHNDEGALGIVVNRASDLKLSDILDQMDLIAPSEVLAQLPVHFGGPVQPERGFVLHEPTGQWASTLKITDSIALTSSRDILEAISLGLGPKKILVALGYAGWGRGQLENEILENSWLNFQADLSIIFDQPIDSRWKAAGHLMGVDIALLTTHAGHG
jgi:putative transcriptional regulator